MRQGWLGMVGVVAALCAWSCGNVGGEITGSVVVAKGFDGLGVFAALWQVPANPSDPTNPHSELVATGEQPIPLGYITIGVADASGGTFKYTFHSLDRGLYIIGAFLDNNQGAGPNLTTDVHEIDQDTPITIDPSVSSMTIVKRDLYLGMSEPDKGTITGTVHLSNQAAAHATNILLLTGNPFVTNAQILQEQAVTGGGADVPYQLFNAPLTPVFIMAVSDLNDNGSVDLNQDLVGFAQGNPIQVDPTNHTSTGVDVWLDRQAPNLGSIQGTIALSASLKTSTVSVLAFSSDYSKDATANVIGVTNVTGTNTDMIPFQLQSMPIGPIYLYALTSTTGAVTATVTGQTEYTGPDQGNPIPVTLTSMQPSATGISFPVGVGRVSGTIQFSNAPADITEAWVTATQNVNGSVYIRQFAQVAIAAGNSSVQYEVFGLMDGTFQMTLVPDLTKTGSLVDNVSSGVVGTPSSVLIMGGGREGSDFTYTFK